MRCADSFDHWCRNHVKTYDPRRIERKLDPVIPFIPFQYQLDVVEWWNWALAESEDTLCDKSRDMGLSWLTIAYDLHKWLFVDAYKCAWGSYKQDKIDLIGDMDAMFPKARFIIKHLPGWMIPKGFKLGGDHDNFMRLVNPATGATITGEAGKNIGRGGRNARYTLDEFAFFEHPQKAEMAVSQNTNCRSYISTPNGRGNLFAQKRFSMPAKNVKSLHWTLHPHKDQAWYDKQAEKLDKITLAQEVDIDYSASIEGVMIPALWVRAAVNLVRKIPEIADGPSIAGLDVGETTDASCYISRKGAAVTRVEQWTGVNTTQTAFKANDLGEIDGIEILRYDSIGIGAGVTGTLQTDHSDAQQEEEYASKEAVQLEDLAFYTFDLVGIPWGTPPEGDAFRDNEEKPLKDRFLNQRAADWWNLRLRFQAAYEHVEGIKEHDPDDMISIPNDPGLIAELSIPLQQASGTGKIKLESKKEMKRRGIKSPNKADALAYCFSTKGQVFVLGAY